MKKTIRLYIAVNMMKIEHANGPEEIRAGVRRAASRLAEHCNFPYFLPPADAQALDDYITGKTTANPYAPPR